MLKEKFAKLVNVKTLVTLTVVGVFAALALRGSVTAENVMVVLTTVISFYFGTQHEKQPAK